MILLIPCPHSPVVIRRVKIGGRESAFFLSFNIGDWEVGRLVVVDRISSGLLGCSYGILRRSSEGKRLAIT